MMLSQQIEENKKMVVLLTDRKGVRPWKRRKRGGSAAKPEREEDPEE